MDLFVVQDDVSYRGLRRVHLLGNSKIPVEEMMARAEDENAELEGVWEWEDDELGQWHIYGVWRVNMASQYSMFCVSVGKGGDVDGALMRAIRMYQERMGEWPNRFLTRVGLVGHEKVVYEKEMVELVRVEVEINFPVGVVGVYRVN